LPGLAGVVDPESNCAYAVTVCVDVVCDGAVGAERRRKDEAHLALLKSIGGMVALSCLRACVSDQLHAEGCAVKIGGLARVADVELNVIGTFEREKIDGLRGALNG